jgi:L-histidine N-alpha-methyltransferase
MKAPSQTHSIPPVVIDGDYSTFMRDVLNGLSAKPKQLSSKYFYDQRGDTLFQKIMESPDYYLTRCEAEIFRDQTAELVRSLTKGIDEPFDLIELGVGDGMKSKFLLRELLSMQTDFKYWPIDISGNILSLLKDGLAHLSDLDYECLEGEYFDMLAQVVSVSRRPKVLMFLGANIGNMPLQAALRFCCELRQALQPGDKLLMGFDLKKNPFTVLQAYNDLEGVTRDFNLNLLERINRELGGDFAVDQFKHYLSDVRPGNRGV